MINVVQLGRVDYATALKLQKSLVELRKEGRIADTLLLLEHPPVITLGRNARRENVVSSEEQLACAGVEVFEADRGGDVTYHGPGQLVGYPIFDLRSYTPRIGAVEFVRRVEEALIRACGDLGVPCKRVEGLTGVWTENLPRRHGDTEKNEAGEAKIAAIGVHISRGVTSHGFALNVATDLEHFKLIVPCGIADKPVTSIARELGRRGEAVPALERVAEAVTRNFGKVFASQVLWVETLDDLMGRAVGVPMRPPEELRQLHEDDIYLA